MTSPTGKGEGERLLVTGDLHKPRSIMAQATMGTDDSYCPKGADRSEQQRWHADPGRNSIVRAERFDTPPQA